MEYVAAIEQQMALLARPKTELTRRFVRLHGDGRALDAFSTTIERADPYFWATDICETIEVTAASAPEWRLRSEDLVTPYGFCFFQHPLPLVPRNARNGGNGTSGRALVGFAWGSQDTGGIWCYSLYDADLLPVTVDGHIVGSVVRAGMGFRWLFGRSIREMVAVVTEPAPHWRSGTELGFLSACFLFMNQRVVAREIRDGTRTRGNGQLHPSPAVRVVRLRRLSRPGAGDAELSSVDWSHRWVVSSHWRRQFYPSLGEHRPILVLPYVKGPEAKPLKPPRGKVFAVVR